MSAGVVLPDGVITPDAIGCTPAESRRTTTRRSSMRTARPMVVWAAVMPQRTVRSVADPAAVPVRCPASWAPTTWWTVAPESTARQVI
ncbi:hypothetical protein I552_0709 [Mycobacterium xenopi 3993]|nr:hypothetical protein I552_0709 [Mycobacterium xenopi 3993]